MNKHETLVDVVYNTLLKKPYVNVVIKHHEYGKLCNRTGECDILTIQGNKLVYYEIKTRDTDSARKRAKTQFKRWLYAFRGSPLALYAVYITPETTKFYGKKGELYDTKEKTNKFRNSYS